MVWGRAGRSLFFADQDACRYGRKQQEALAQNAPAVNRLLRLRTSMTERDASAPGTLEHTQYLNDIVSSLACYLFLPSSDMCSSVSSFMCASPVVGAC